MANKRVAVVILNWNGKKMLADFLPSVIRHTPSEIADVIVADNGSTDGSVAFLEDNHPEIGLIKFSDNHGFAEGYNLALAELQGQYKYAVLLNSDVKVSDDWLTPLYDFMEKHPEVGAVQPKILSLNEPEKFEYAGASGGFIDRNGYPYCRGRIFDTLETDLSQYDEPIEIDWASGAALMVDIDLYIKLGGLDSNFFAHMEEIDLCWRIRLAGKQVWVVPSAKVYHLGGGSLPASNPQKTYLNFRNNLLMLYKNLPANVRNKALVRRRLLDTIAWAKFIVGFDFANAKSILKAHRDYLKMRKLYTSGSQSDADTPNLLSNRPNILTDYFLRGKKRFSDL